METVDQRLKREAAVAAFKARGRDVERCPPALARGIVKFKKGEARYETWMRELEKMRDLGIVPPAEKP